MMLRFQKCLFLNIYIDIVWIMVVAFFLYAKMDSLKNLTKYLTVTVFALLVVIEIVRLYLGFYGNLSCRVPELAGFLMLTTLMQMPLVSFFLINPYLMSTPTELTLHTMLWVISLTEIFLSYFALKHASVLTKSIFLSRLKDKYR